MNRTLAFPGARDALSWREDAFAPQTLASFVPAAPGDGLDRRVRGFFARRIGGSSPWAAALAWADYTYHMALSPARTVGLAVHAWESALRLAAYAWSPNPHRAALAPYAPEADDRRFRHALWTVAPFDAMAQAQLAAESWWSAATAPLPGVSAHHMARARFLGRHVLNAFSPGNFIWSNPEVLAAARSSAGLSLVRGALHAADDAFRVASGQSAFGVSDHAVGKNMAVSPGAVVYRNDLFELIQYAPRTEHVRPEPVLIVPAWIMKYYILDLTDQDSLVRHLTDQGFTVFCMSWRNPSAGDRDIALDDYRVRGVVPALEAALAITGAKRAHGVGYCLGGTLLAIAAAAMARADDDRLATLSLFAAQTDFSEAGDLMLFIDENQLALLEDMMSVQGVLDARQMAGSFYALRANDLFWARVVERYLIGKRHPASALEAWLADATRMPARMHSEYLRWLFLENRFSLGRLRMGGEVVALRDLKLPIFALGAERDHIAPWRSVHKIALFAGGDTTFALSGGGHNSAVVSPPGKAGAYYRINTISSSDEYQDPERWAHDTPPIDGSWWGAWTDWLAARSAPQAATPPGIGAPILGYPTLGPAPGTYVYGR